jgi:Ran GTPase-activating protein (RanGAP) involved in mRNA processing and transport
MQQTSSDNSSNISIQRQIILHNGLRGFGYLRLDLSAIDSDNYISIVQSINDDPTIHSLEFIRGEIRDFDFMKILECFSKNTTLRTVSLAECNLGTDERFYIPRFARTLEQWFTTSTAIRSINLADNGLSGEATTTIARAIGTSSVLVELDLSGNEFGPDSCPHLARLIAGSSLQSLNLANNCIGDDGATTLATALTSNTTLQRFSVACNDIQHRGGRAIVAALNHNTSLREIYLGYNKLSFQVIRDFAEMMKTNNTIHTINFREVIRGPKTIMQLANVLATKKSIRSIDLSNNVNFDDAKDDQKLYTQCRVTFALLISFCTKNRIELII